MPCDPFLGGIICTSGKGRKATLCFVRDCHRPGDVLCDWIIARPKGPDLEGKIQPLRCSRSCCRIHARHVDVDKDLCLEHVLAAQKVGAIK